VRSLGSFPGFHANWCELRFAPLHRKEFPWSRKEFLTGVEAETWIALLERHYGLALALGSQRATVQANHKLSEPRGTALGFNFVLYF